MNKPGKARNIAVVGSETNDPNLANNSDGARVSVSEPGEVEAETGAGGGPPFAPCPRATSGPLPRC